MREILQFPFPELRDPYPTKIAAYNKVFIQFRNGKLDSSFKRLLEIKPSVVTGETRFSKHTHAPNTSDYDLFGKVLTATTRSDRETFVGGSLPYLFFFECLPGTLQNK